MPSADLVIRCKRRDDSFSLTDPVHREFLRNGIELWYAPLAPMRSMSEALVDNLSANEKQRAERFHFEKDRERFVIGHYLLRLILADYVERSPTDLEFARMEFGKPYLKEFPNLHFNFSDTRDSILVGVSNDSPIGVDIETTTRELDHEGVAQHYFTEPEITELRNAADPKARFLEFWTRKEAILKASGIGIMDDVRVLQVNKEDQLVQISHKDMVALSASEYHLCSGTIGEHNILSYASESELSCEVVYDALQL